MRTGLASIDLILTESGRRKMRGWLVRTPKGTAKVVAVEPMDSPGEWSVTVFGDFGDGKPAHQTFNAVELRLL